MPVGVGGIGVGACQYLVPLLGLTSLTPDAELKRTQGTARAPPFSGDRLDCLSRRP